MYDYQRKFQSQIPQGVTEISHESNKLNGTD